MSSSELVRVGDWGEEDQGILSLGVDQGRPTSPNTGVGRSFTGLHPGGLGIPATIVSHSNLVSSSHSKQHISIDYDFHFANWNDCVLYWNPLRGVAEWYDV